MHYERVVQFFYAFRQLYRSNEETASCKDNEQESLNDEEIQTETSFSALLSTYDTPSSSSQSSTSRKRMRSGNSNDLTTEILQLAGEKLQAIHFDDEFDVYGKYIAHKLRNLRGNQKIFARKLINDVIFLLKLWLIQDPSSFYQWNLNRNLNVAVK
ncbi:hypothetical protein ABEB36_014052 [Hypothenemus hampei]|uniref:Uncharacterized protein n=1 Tax=Hypothenemus hampei TaxID=57062 RepID=A0ABD1E356_HYPHA